MTTLHPDIESAITGVLDSAADQPPEFKRRMRQLIVNATSGNWTDSDVRDVIQLVEVVESQSEFTDDDL